MDTSLTPDFKNSLAEKAWRRTLRHVWRWSAGGLDRVYLVKELSGELGVRTPQADSEPGLSVPLPVWGENTGGNRFDT